MLIDSHCHLDDYEDLAPILANAEAAGVRKLLAIGIGEGPDTMHRALELANQHPEIFATAGIHPQEAQRATPEALAKLAALVQDPRCIAIGEIGLDYYHLGNPDIPTQHAAFIAQLKIAAAVRKPITIHCRTSELAIPAAKQKYEPADAWEDLLALLAEHWTPHNLPGIMHCFSGNEAQAARSLAIGFYLSFAGNVTYPKSVTIQQVAASAPADRILVETDAPFLTPIPLRGQPNEPANTALTASFVANLRGISPASLAEQTTANFHRLFPATA
ncbi:TatD family hydrolase [Granulicella paludicola]|uniref:TatD family hydrolase n=1 Tax=Granulicella paludicola TaxID=474951 RepID=UPI0021E06148|nr:TatD family hydrolase [Granulicella paludicola]